MQIKSVALVADDFTMRMPQTWRMFCKSCLDANDFDNSFGNIDDMPKVTKDVGYVDVQMLQHELTLSSSKTIDHV